MNIYTLPVKVSMKPVIIRGPRLKAVDYKLTFSPLTWFILLGYMH